MLEISPLVTDVDVGISASFAVVEIDQVSEDEVSESLIAAAGAALYNAKWLGRNWCSPKRLTEHEPGLVAEPQTARPFSPTVRRLNECIARRRPRN